MMNVIAEANEIASTFEWP